MGSSECIAELSEVHSTQEESIMTEIAELVPQYLDTDCVQVGSPTKMSLVAIAYLS